MNEYSHTRKYFSIMKGNEEWIHATLWMNIQNSMLSERSEAQDTTHYTIMSKEPSRTDKSTETELQLVPSGAMHGSMRETAS